MLLLALGRFSQGIRELPFAVVRPALTELLREFGPTRIANHPEYPFWRLQSDGVWEVQPREGLVQRASNTDPTTRALLSANAIGRFPKGIQQLLTRTQGLVQRSADLLLTNHFPQSLHSDIRNAVGLSPENAELPRCARTAGFRREVLISYGYACAVCRLSLRLNDATIGLDAAHIRWRQADGPDVVTNGLALCSLHHKLFDLGAFTLSESRRVLVSERVTGSEQLRDVLHAYHNAPLAAPVRPENQPGATFVAWHRQQVFKESPLPTPHN